MVQWVGLFCGRIKFFLILATPTPESMESLFHFKATHISHGVWFSPVQRIKSTLNTFKTYFGL